MPATVSTSTTRYAAQYAYHRKGFYAAGLFWVFFSNGTNAGWEFSADGTTWAGAFTSIGAALHGRFFSIWFDGTYIHYARTDYDGTEDTYYRRGVPENDGTITWSAAEQTVHTGTSTDRYPYPCVAVDTNGYAWIAAQYDFGAVETPYVLKNANLDGTWALDFAYQLSVIDNSVWRAGIVPLTDGKMYAFYGRPGTSPLGRLYDAGWGAEENTLTDFPAEDGYGFSVVAIQDNVHILYNRDVTYQIRHNERVWGVGWNANDVLVQDAVSLSCNPVLSSNPSVGDLYCFWTRTPNDHVYYKRYTGGAWDGAATDWIDETADDIQLDYFMSGFYKDYGGYIGLIYITKLAPPWKVRFAFLTFPAWEGKIMGVESPSNLAKINGVGIENIDKVMGVP